MKGRYWTSSTGPSSLIRTCIELLWVRHFNSGQYCDYVSTKITPTERMLNLVIALLGSSRGRSRHYIREHVNGYSPAARTASEEETAGAAFERMFERDKGTLRELGVPITTETSFDDDFQEQALYRIKPEDYQVPEVRLDEPSMMILAIAANLWTGAAFSDAAASALRKVASRAGIQWSGEEASLQARVSTSEIAFEPLWTALRDSRQVTFDYLNVGAAAPTARRVQPWGMGSKYGEWYLSAFDVDRQAQRSFRLSRIQSPVRIEAKESFIRDPHFSITTVLDELGAQEPANALVEVAQNSGHSLRTREGVVVLDAAAREKIDAVSILGSVDVLSIPYREGELMADDLAAYGAQVRVLAPAALQEAVSRRLMGALSAQQAAVGDTVFGAPISFRPTKRKDNRDRLIRLLSMVPFLVANPGIEEDELTAEFGITAQELQADLNTLMVSGLPGYQHGDLMDVTKEHGQVFIHDAETLSAPLRLSQEEACALLVGLEAIRVLPGSQTSAAWNQARTQLRRLAGSEAWLADAVSLQLVPTVELEKINRLQHLIQTKHMAQIRYVVRSRDEITRRIIEPRRLYSIDSTWYVRAWCQLAQGFRSFRLDQLQAMHDAGTQEHGDLTDSDFGDPSPWSGNEGIRFELVARSSTAKGLSQAYHADVFELDENSPRDHLGVRLQLGTIETLAALLARLAGSAWLVNDRQAQAAVSEWLRQAVESNNWPGTGSNHAVSESTSTVPSQDG